MSANEVQHGGTHYKTAAIQPWDCVTEWELGYLDGTALKYIARWKKKNGLEDIRKAIHFLQKLIEVEEAAEQSRFSLRAKRDLEWLDGQKASGVSGEQGG